jgi:hypothetical protein
MHDYRDFLLSKAFRIVPGQEYNRVSYELRENKRGPLFAIYEIVLHEGQSWEDMREKVYPALVRYLKYKGMPPASGAGLMIALFSRDFFYLIDGPDFLGAYCEIEGISPGAFQLLVSRWLSSEGPGEKHPLLKP